MAFRGGVLAVAVNSAVGQLCTDAQVGKNNDGTNLQSSAIITGSAADCCSQCAAHGAEGCVGYTWVHNNQECWLKSAVDHPRDDGCGGCVTSGTVGFNPPGPPPAPTPVVGLVEYCPDPAVDFHEEVESGAQGTVTWTSNGWSIQGQRRVSSKASFDFSGGKLTWDMDLSQAHGGVNNNFYVTYPYEENCGISCYCDSGGNHDSQGRGCAELDFTENNGGCFQATTWHDDESGGDGPGYGGHGALGGGSISCSAEYNNDGSYLNINIGDNFMSGNGQTEVMKSKGAVLYSSQWVGWVPGDCGEGDLSSSVYAVKNLKITGRVVQGPEPRRCDSIATTATPCPSSCTGGDDGASLKECVTGCPSATFSDCVDCCSCKFPSTELV
jgi:hypothetical protein